MRARLVSMFCVTVASLMTVGVSAAPMAPHAVSPVVGLWSIGKSAGPVLEVKWDPRGLHGPMSAEFSGVVIQDFQFELGACWHRKGEVLFEAKKAANFPWPTGFEGSGVNWTYSAGNCGGTTDKLTLQLYSYATLTPPRLELGVCPKACYTFWRGLMPGEKLDPDQWAEYVFPGQFKPMTGLIAFVVDASGPLTDPQGRWIRDLQGSVQQNCSLWTPETLKWTPQGTATVTGAINVAGAPRIPITQPGVVAFSNKWTAAGTAYSLDLQGTFVEWTRLKGTVRLVTYSPVNAASMPADLDRPGKITLQRCDSGASPFAADHMPGSWQAIHR